MRTFANTVTITQSEQLSAAVAIAPYDHLALVVPSLTSCTLTLRGGQGATSAEMIPIEQANAAGSFALLTETGSKAFSVTDLVANLPDRD